MSLLGWFQTMGLVVLWWSCFKSAKSGRWHRVEASFFICFDCTLKQNIFYAMLQAIPDSKVHGPTWGPSGADRTQVRPMLALWTLLSGIGLYAAIRRHVVKRFAWIHRPLGGLSEILDNNFQNILNDWWQRYPQWSCHQMNATGLHWWKVNISSDNGLVPSDNKPLPKPMWTKIFIYSLTRPRWFNQISNGSRWLIGPTFHCHNQQCGVIGNH